MPGDAGQREARTIACAATAGAPAVRYSLPRAHSHVMKLAPEWCFGPTSRAELWATADLRGKFSHVL